MAEPRQETPRKLLQFCKKLQQDTLDVIPRAEEKDVTGKALSDWLMGRLAVIQFEKLLIISDGGYTTPQDRLLDSFATRVDDELMVDGAFSSAPYIRAGNDGELTWALLGSQIKNPKEVDVMAAFRAIDDYANEKHGTESLPVDEPIGDLMLLPVRSIRAVMYASLQPLYRPSPRFNEEIAA